MKHPKTVLLAMMVISMTFGSTAVYASDITPENSSSEFTLASETDTPDGSSEDADTQTSETEGSADTETDIFQKDTTTDDEEEADDQSETPASDSDTGSTADTDTSSADGSSDQTTETDTETETETETDDGSDEEPETVGMTLGQSYSIDWTSIYTFTPDKTGYYEFRSTSDNDPYIYLRDHAGNELAYADNMSSSNTQFDLIIHLEKGRTYTLDMGMNDTEGAALTCTITRQNASPYNGIMSGADGSQYYTVKHQINYDYTGIVKDIYGNWYVLGGKLQKNYTGLVKNAQTVTATNDGPIPYVQATSSGSTSWTYISGGAAESSYTGLAQYGSTWYYVKNSVPDTSYTGLVKYKSDYYYVKKGVRDLTYTGAVKYNNITWYVNNGKLDRSYTGGLTIGSKVYKVIRGRVSTIDIVTQMENTYVGICRMSGRTPYNDDFNGYCGAYSAWSLLYLGITSEYQGFDGNQAYDTYKNVSKSSGGYSVTAYGSGSGYNLKTALLKATANGTKDIFDVLVGFDKGSVSYAGQTWGHTFFIHAIIKGVVYYTESFTSSVMGITEGEVMKCSINELYTRYSTGRYGSSDFDGIIHFQN